MGTRTHLVVTGGSADLLDELEARLQDLEQRWSRFLPTSEVSRLNASPDQWHLVSRDTVLLLARACAGWRATGGAFDPTVLEAVRASGYTTSFDELAPIAHRTEPAPQAPGCGSIDIDTDLGLVRLGAGVQFDPGGIGKGLAADLLVSEALTAGARGAMVNIGGDLACAGAPPGDGGWLVELIEPTVADDRIAVLGLVHGGVATSTTAKRRWVTDDGERHHIIEPNTGRSTAGLELVTAVAADAWYAEVVATHLLVQGLDAPVDLTKAAALAIDREGATHSIGAMDRFLR